MLGYLRGGTLLLTLEMNEERIKITGQLVDVLKKENINMTKYRLIRWCFY